MLPRGGVALRKSKKENKDSYSSDQQRRKTYNVFCFLPLPLKTGLPVHVNGHFALDHEARRNLWTDDKLGYRSEWNEHIIKNIIAPIYIKCILQWKTDLELEAGSQINTSDLRQKMLLYHEVFPMHKNVNGDIWKHLVSAIYKLVHKHEVPLFLSCKHLPKSKVLVNCFPLHCKADTFQVVFNTLQKQLKEMYPYPDYNKKASALERLAKDLNMKLVDTPYWLYDTIEESGVKVANICPNFFIDFLLSYTSNAQDACSLSGVGRDVSITKFKHMDNLKECLRYCIASKAFAEKVNGVPLCVTEDCILRTFSDQRPFFLSCFSKLFRGSKAEFVALGIIADLSIIQPKTISLKQVSIQDLPKLLADSFSQLRCSTAIQWNQTTSSIPDKSWISSLWDLLSTLVTPNPGGNKILSPIFEWCVIPAMQKDVSFLYPLCKAKDVVDLFSFAGSIREAIKSLQLPFLCIEKSSTPQKTDEKGFLLLKAVVTSCKNPTDLLECLHSHRGAIAERKKESKHCNEILFHLCDRLEDILTKLGTPDALDRLRSLPLYAAVHGEMISVPVDKKVFVLPSGMPSAGIKEWAEKTGTTLLRISDKLLPLYKKLGITESSINTVYKNQIFPTWMYLPAEYRIVHLEYIRDNLLSKRFACLSMEETSMIQSLKQLPFIVTETRETKKASAFFNSENVLFQNLCEKCEFPPEPFCKSEWNHFMLSAGMRNDVDPSLFLQFAKRIEKYGGQQAMKDLHKKSNCLVNHFFQSKSLHIDSVTEYAKNIRFVVPHNVSQTLLNIHEQCKRSETISFNGSLLKRHERLVWSNTPLLPGWATPDNIGKDGAQLKKRLGIKDPSVESVVEHVRNICTRLNDKTSREDISDTSAISEIIVDIYKYLNEEGVKTSHQKHLKSVRNVPILFLPDRKRFVKCNQSVIGLRKENEIAGYLVQCPELYGPYYPLFEFLGTQREGTCNVYAHVIASIKAATKEKPLHPNEITAVGKAVDLFFQTLPRQEEDVNKQLTETLYLLSTECVLIDAKELIFVDSGHFAKKIQGARGVHFLLDFRELKVSVRIGEPEISRLPERIRPKLLTTLLTEKVNVVALNIPPCDDEQHLNEFLHSVEFLNGFLRIASHELSFDGTKQQLDKEGEEKIKLALTTVRFQQVSDIQTVNFLHSAEITKQSKECHYVRPGANEKSSHTIMFIVPEDVVFREFVPNLSDSFIEALSGSTKVTISRHRDTIMKLLLSYQKPEVISHILDKREIPNIVRSVKREGILPNVGEFVVPHFHDLLDNSFGVFEEGDYVALLIQDDKRDENGQLTERVYIYARILKKLPREEHMAGFEHILQKYIVKVGHTKTEIKAAFDLYKFTRDTKRWGGSMALVLYQRAEADQSTDEQPQSQTNTGRPSQTRSQPSAPSTGGPTNDQDNERDDRPLKEIYKEVRETLKSIWRRLSNIDERSKVCKRLLRKWHPDKNHGNEEKATEVFKYIKNIINLLEEGRDIPDNEDDVSQTRQHSTRPNPSSWFNDDFWEDFNRGCRGERQRWEHYRSHHRSYDYFSGGSSSFYDFYGRHREYEPNPQPSVARHWLRQARKDVAMARATFTAAMEEGAFNWTCYMCHQVYFHYIIYQEFCDILVIR